MRPMYISLRRLVRFCRSCGLDRPATTRCRSCGGSSFSRRVLSSRHGRRIGCAQLSRSTIGAVGTVCTGTFSPRGSLPCQPFNGLDLVYLALHVGAQCCAKCRAYSYWAVATIFGFASGHVDGGNTERG